ncbi:MULTISPECIES: GntR family transcriptional regulator [Psychrobacillus]|jgi:DNA-binding GntR family transcriptional regulator|uniref:GntR family transcriptional regulator n=1 Tax=Psychrobacillus faecigallinarum TaxID=2762235 RepID=A0ABR8RC27_9BACI|nr:GntR family transcriptional regulator [Psychrobacillus faecigallinarum]MBD7945306.1 GntR family transcriptional regulator [Psychrobacillus faecigallinarum]QGM32282.1 FCD domain-containing protein [Bacillus sp. N3536]
MPIPVDHTKPVRTTAKLHAFNQLQQWIIDGTLQPDEKLNDIELAQALGVSRTPIRESLQLLESQGFVTMQPGRATQVTPVEPEDIYNLLPPLSVLQALAAELATPNMDEETLNLLEQKNNEFAEALHAQNFTKALKLDEEFHQLIVDRANNPYIFSMVEMLQAHVRRLYYYEKINLREYSIEQHKELIRLFKEKDIPKLAEVMRANWIYTIEKF